MEIFSNEIDFEIDMDQFDWGIGLDEFDWDEIVLECPDLDFSWKV